MRAIGGIGLLQPLFLSREGEIGGKILGSPVHSFAAGATTIRARPGYAVDVFKLESPVNAEDADGSEGVQELFDEMGRLAGRPWVMLSAGAGKEAFKNILTHAFKAGASGFLAGRAIWLDAFNHYPDWSAIHAKLETESVEYMKNISELADREAKAWNAHPCYGDVGARFQPTDSSFRHRYDAI